MVIVRTTLRRLAVALLDLLGDRIQLTRHRLAGAAVCAIDQQDLEREEEREREREREELAASPAETDEPPASSSYAALWNPSAVPEAMAQIYNTTDEASFEEGGRLDFEWLARHLRPEHTTLDLGCGIGRVAYYVAQHCQHLWAIDVSPRMLELAQERMSGLNNVSYGLCEDISFPDVPSMSIDLAYSLLVLQHVEREDAFCLLEELCRVVRPGGRVMLTFPNLLSPLYLKCFTDGAHRRASSHVNRARPYTAEEVSCLVEAAGFEKPTLEVETEIRVTAQRS